MPDAVPNRRGRGRCKEYSPSCWRLRSGCGEAGEFEAEDPKPKPGDIPLASLSGGEARGVLGTGGRPRGPRSEMSDVSGFHVKDVMDMDLNELIQKYNRTVRAAGLFRYMLEANHGLTEEPEQKTWTLVRQAKYQEFQAWKRHKVWCCLRDARDTRCLLHCPWRPPRLFCALQTFRVLSPDSALVTKLCSPRLICLPCHRPCPRSCRRRNIPRSTRCRTNRRSTGNSMGSMGSGTARCTGSSRSTRMRSGKNRV